MRTVRWSSVGLGLMALTLVAALGGVLDRLYDDTGRGTLRAAWFEAFFTDAVGPFAGGFREPVQPRAAVAWVLGLVVALAVLAAVLAPASRAGSGFATVAGGWLGCILGCGLGGVAATLVGYVDVLGDASSQQVAVASYASLTHGLYWGAVVGWFVGAVALLGGVGLPRTR